MLFLLRAGRCIPLVRFLSRGSARRRRSGVRGGRIRGWRVGHCGHGAFWIQQMVLARAQSQLDQGARVGYGFALPAMVCLVAPHGFFAGLVPRAGGFSTQIVLADQSFLNGMSSLGIDFLLAAGAR